ncbi:DUF4390 domain-containing protein [candidate division KSB1 bacterium]
MVKILKSACILLLVLIYLPGNLTAQDNNIAVDSLWIEDGYLNLSFHITDLFNEDILDGMKKGLTINITYNIDLWQSRSRWFDKNIMQVESFFKVGYNRFDQRYVWYDTKNLERLTTSSFERIDNKCSYITGIALIDTSRIQPGKEYYVAIEGILEPLSVENLEEMRKWLTGEVSDLGINTNPVESPKKLSNRFLIFVKNISGFGDQQYSVRGRNFVISRARDRITYRSR